MAWPVTLNGRTYTSTDFDGVNYVDGLPDAFQDFVTHAASTMQGTSTTSVAIGTGSKSFTTQTGKVWAVGTPLRVANTASPSTQFMDGVVTSYNSGTGALVVNVVGITGTGTLATWTISPGGGGYALSTPVTVALGGTGATTAAAGIAALGGLPLAGGTMTGALLLSGDPTADLHPVTRRWLEQQAHKDACRAASTATVTLTAPGTAIDGITLSTGDRVLLKNQTASAENGIYVFQGSASTMTRATDMDVWTDVPNATCSIEEGTVNGNTVWLCQNTITGTLNTTAITWQLVSNAQVAALGLLATTGFVNRTGANTFTTTASATAATASTIVARDASADITTNTVVLGNGTTTLPAVRFAGDTNTGLRWISTDSMSLLTGGVDRIITDSAGNVGVGMTPSNLADLRNFSLKGPNSGSGYAIFVAECGLNTKQAIFQINGANGHVDVGTATGNTTGNLSLTAGGSTRMILLTGGDVGINITPTPITDQKHILIKGPNSGLGFACFRAESGVATKQGIFQCQETAGNVLVGTDVFNTTGLLGLWAGGGQRVTINAAGETMFQQSATTTPGYAGNTTVGAAIWNGRMFQNMDDFSGWNLQRPGAVATGTFVTLSSLGVAVGNIGTNGTVTSYNTTSDYRLKQDAEVLTDALDRLDQLQPRRFRFKSDPTMAKVDGFFAHEAALVVPESVTGEQDEADFGGNPVYQSMDATKLVPLLVGAVQQLRAEFNAYKASHP